MSITRTRLTSAGSPRPRSASGSIGPARCCRKRWSKRRRLTHQRWEESRHVRPDDAAVDRTAAGRTRPRARGADQDALPCAPCATGRALIRLAHARRAQQHGAGLAIADRGPGCRLFDRGPHSSRPALPPSLVLPRGFAPRTPPHTLSRAPLRRRAPFAWLARALARGASQPVIFT